MSVVGIYRDEETLKPDPYLKIVSNIDERLALIVDPMLATGGSMIVTIDLLKQKGCKQDQGDRTCCALKACCAAGGSR